MDQAETRDSLVGKRIRFIHSSDPWTNLQFGDLGTIVFVDDLGTLDCTWDSGSSLGMVPGIDQYQILQD